MLNHIKAYSVKPYYLKNKMYIGVSGHRNLKQAQIDTYKQQIKILLLKLIKDNLEKELIILSALADGADRLVVDVAIELELRYEVYLPMASHVYKKDFSTTSLDEYRRLIRSAISIPNVITLCDSCTEVNIAEYGKYRDRQYLKLGKEIVDQSDIMVFLWDQKDSRGLGGTADIIFYAKQKDTSYIIIECEREI